MGNFDLGKLENEAYALTVNLFSFYKTLKENGIVLDNSNEVLKAVSEISSFVLEIDQEPCKYYDKLESIIKKVTWSKEQITAYELSDKYNSAKADLLLQINIIEKQFKLLLN